MKTLFVCAAILAGTLVYGQDAIPFTFHNSSLKSIPLIIPGVMNPNLSPQSDSGVNLNIGQKVWFKNKGRRYLLLEVTEDMRAEDNERVRLDIAKLVRERRKELGLRSKQP